MMVLRRGTGQILAKTLSTTSLARVKSSLRTSVSVANARPFEDIPRPPGRDLPFVGDIFNLTRKYGFGQFWKNLLEYRNNIPDDIALLRLHLPTFKNKGGNGYVVIPFDPDDIETIYRNEGKYPNRGGTLDVFKILRATRKDVFEDTPGLILEEGEKWLEYRKKVQQDLMRPKSAFYYIEDIDAVAKEFVEYLRRNRDSESLVVNNLLMHVQRYAFEAVSVVAIDTKMGTLGTNPDPVLLEKLEVGEQLINMFPKMAVTAPFWKVVPPKLFPSYREGLHLFNVFLNFVRDKVYDAGKRIDAKLEMMKNETDQEMETSVLEKMLLRNGKNSKLPIIMALDMVVAGTDTTGNTGTFLLYNLARNKSKQERLREEILSFNKDVLTEKELGKMKYFKACLRESFRMTPTISLLTRLLPEDIVLKGFRIPAGTWMIWSPDVLGKDPRYFPDADKYLPERWLDPQSSIPPTLVRQFGHGPRMCIGKRFAELELQLMIANVVKNFDLEWVGSDEPVETKFVFTNVPNKDIMIKFNDRN